MRKRSRRRRKTCTASPIESKTVGKTGRPVGTRVEPRRSSGRSPIRRLSRSRRNGGPAP